VIPSSLNPVWKNESFTLDVHSLVSQYLLLWVFDHDSSKYDDEMCYVQLSLGAMQVRTKLKNLDPKNPKKPKPLKNTLNPNFEHQNPQNPDCLLTAI
jgi:Ca2+-dependent lipid-binding protein